jgi:ribosomal protein L32
MDSGIEVIMMKKKSKNGASTAMAVMKKSQPKKPSKTKRRSRLTNEKLREVMAKNKPPQSWYDEDHTGLY